MSSSSSPSPSPKVLLNIGGERFETSQATLSKVPRSFFTRLLANPSQVVRDSDGAYFIDRDGRLFSLILSWLRTFNPSAPLQRSTNLLVSYRNGQMDKVCDITGLPYEMYGNGTHRSLVREVEFYGLIPLLFALDPTHPSVTTYNPASSPSRKEELETTIREWEGESNIPDLALLKLYQTSLTQPALSSKAAAEAAAAQEAEQAVSDFDGLGGFALLLEGVKASLMSGNGEVTWAPPAGFDMAKHGDAIAVEVKRRYGLTVLILGTELQLQPIA